MIKHIFTIIWNQRKSNTWLVAELLIISVSLWFIFDYTGMMLHMKNSSTGFDISHTYRIFIKERSPESENYIAPSDKQTSLGEDILTVVEHIRRNPSVEAVSLSLGFQPKGSLSGAPHRQLIYNDTVHIMAREYKVNPSFFDVFHVEPAQEKYKNLKEALTYTGIILSSDLEKEFSSSGSMVGKQIMLGENGYNKQVVSLSHTIRPNEYSLSAPCYFNLLSEEDILTGANSNNLKDLEICVRIKPEIDKEFEDKFIQEMSPQLFIGNLFLVDVRSSSSIRQQMIQGDTSQLFINTMLLIFLLLNIFLGVFGTFTFRTQQRKGETGLRIALGSSRPKILSLFIAEGLLLLAIATLPAFIIDLNIGLLELLNIYWRDFTVGRFLLGTGFTFGVVSCMIIIAVWYPAYRSAKIQPAEALHYE